MADPQRSADCPKYRLTIVIVVTPPPAPVVEVGHDEPGIDQQRAAPYERAPRQTRVTRAWLPRGGGPNRSVQAKV